MHVVGVSLKTLYIMILKQYFVKICVIDIIIGTFLHFLQVSPVENIYGKVSD